MSPVSTNDDDGKSRVPTWHPTSVKPPLVTKDQFGVCDLMVLLVERDGRRGWTVGQYVDVEPQNPSAGFCVPVGDWWHGANVVGWMVPDVNGAVLPADAGDYPAERVPTPEPQVDDIPTMTLSITLDMRDYDTLLGELEFRKDRLTPDGNSCETGSAIAEMIRDLREYRDLWNASNPPAAPQVDSATVPEATAPEPNQDLAAPEPNSEPSAVEQKTLDRLARITEQMESGTYDPNVTTVTVERPNPQIGETWEDGFGCRHLLRATKCVSPAYARVFPLESDNGLTWTADGFLFADKTDDTRNLVRRVDNIQQQNQGHADGQQQVGGGVEDADAGPVADSPPATHPGDVKVYLAASWNRRDLMRSCREQLLQQGIKCTSRWLDEKDGTPPAEASQVDLDDIKSADAMITVTERPEVGYTSGGRHVECGYAIAIGKPIIVIGPRENVFHHLPQVRVVDSLGDAIAILRTHPGDVTASDNPPLVIEVGGRYLCRDGVTTARIIGTQPSKGYPFRATFSHCSMVVTVRSDGRQYHGEETDIDLIRRLPDMVTVEVDPEIVSRLNECGYRPVGVRHVRRGDFYMGGITVSKCLGSGGWVALIVEPIPATDATGGAQE